MSELSQDVRERMREDWNRRAIEDANYYVAFGRRDQDEEEFFSTAKEVLLGLEAEMRRMAPAASPRARRAIEIGCGPGRLLKPLSRHFGEIHGVDVSDEMIRMARENLAAIPHAHAHASSGADLAAFADESFDFVYSYAVFQHIPDREVVFSYLREARRVMKPGAILRAQFNGLPDTARVYDTWSGARIPARDVAQFALDHDFQLLALEGVATQYLWTTWRKRPAGWRGSLAERAPTATARIVKITNANGSEPLVPARGRFAFASLWVAGLSDEFDLNHARILMDGRAGEVSYIGPPEADGIVQINVAVPRGTRTGLVDVELRWLGRRIAEPATLRVIPNGPSIPFLMSVADGVNLLSGTRIVSGSVKVTIEEVCEPFEFSASIGHRPVREIDIFRADPMPPRYEINFQLPENLAAGPYTLDMLLNGRRLAPISIDVVPQP
jgi:SAM-dependent methyltransferase